MKTPVKTNSDIRKTTATACVNRRMMNTVMAGPSAPYRSAKRGGAIAAPLSPYTINLP